jgi:putative transposase
VDESTLGWLPWRHIFGAYNWATDEIVYLISDKRNSDNFIAFLDHLVQQHSGERPLVIVLDNGSIHHSHATQAAFALLENEILPLFLPKYCSQLNPIERFWKHLKSLACADTLFSDMEALVASVKRNLAQQNDFRSDSRFMFLKNFS